MVYYRRELAHHLMKSGFIKSETVAVVEADAILSLIEHGFVDEYRPHYHYPVKCNHPELYECVTIHDTYEDRHTVCLVCRIYLFETEILERAPST